MNIRQPCRAGSFYEDSPASCRHHAGRLLDSAELPDDLPAVIHGGLVPHAGWMYSGQLAAMTFKALAAGGQVESLVLLGADHCGAVRCGEVFDSGVWRSPLGDAQIDEQLAAALLKACPDLRANPAAHAREHSIEVQIPLVQSLFPQAKIVPISVPATESAVEIGEAIGRTIAGSPGVRVVGSTDLTHHGGHFPAPGGHGDQGMQWTTKNDRRMLDLIEAMAADKIVPEASRRMNACGAGAIAATVAACREMGATRGIVLEYTNSYKVIRKIFPGESDDTTVGYASVVFA